MAIFGIFLPLAQAKYRRRLRTKVTPKELNFQIHECDEVRRALRNDLRHHKSLIPTELYNLVDELVVYAKIITVELKELKHERINRHKIAKYMYYTAGSTKPGRIKQETADKLNMLRDCHTFMLLVFELVSM